MVLLFVRVPNRSKETQLMDFVHTFYDANHIQLIILDIHTIFVNKHRQLVRMIINAKPKSKIYESNLMKQNVHRFAIAWFCSSSVGLLQFTPYF